MSLTLALLTASAVTAAPAGCYRPAANEIVVQRLTLRGHQSNYEAVSVSRRLSGGRDALAGRMIVYGRHCVQLFERRFGDAWEVRFQTARLGAESVLLATAVRPGASESGYVQLVLGYGRSLCDLSPIPLDNGDTGGLYVGDLGSGRGPGLARWDGIWGQSEAHYSPHHFEVTLYRWRGGRLVRNAHYVTRNRLDSDPDRAARALGFRFRDMTRRPRFALTNAIMYEAMRPVP